MSSRWSQFRAHLRLRRPKAGALDFLGPGLLVTVGFIDPGNWASNVAAGSAFGYGLLWVVTLSTVMLILLQHNAAHLGIVSGLCMSEATTRFLPRWIGRPALWSAVGASVATAFAEILGGAIALKMLFGLPLKLGGTLTAVVVAAVLLLNSYKVLEKLVVGFVSLIGLAFLAEVLLVKVGWAQAAAGWVTPSLPPGSGVIVLSVLGAVVMPHNLFLHSEFIQSRQYHLQGEDAIESHLKYEAFDTLFSMGIGWAINSAMVILAAATFFQRGLKVDALEQAEQLLRPMVGGVSALLFALALLAAGLASTLTAGMAGGSIFAGLFDRPYDIQDRRTRQGIALTLGLALGAQFLVVDSFQALVWSQVVLSLQLPVTVVLLIVLTSNPKIMGAHANKPFGKLLLWTVAAVVIALNVYLLAKV